MNIPNTLTIIRILLIPVFVFIYFNSKNGLQDSIFILVLIVITDLLDGFIARAFKMITKLGEILDPVADKLAQAAVCICLLIDNIMPLWFVIILLIKEALMLTGGAILIKNYDKAIPAKWYGKLATAYFYFVVLIVFITEKSGYLKMHNGLKNTLFVTAILFSLFSMVSYYNIYFRNRKNTKAGKFIKKSKERVKRR